MESARTNRGVWRVVRRVLIGAGVLYAAYAALAFAGQRALVFPGQFIEPFEPVLDTATTVTWIAAGADSVEAWLLPPTVETSEAYPVFIYAHGNAELIDFAVPTAQPARARGFGVLLIEFPGYGRSGGSPSRTALIEAYTNGYDWLVARPDVDAEAVVFLGRSLGGAVVCDLAVRRSSRALVLQSTFTDLASMASGMGLPSLLVRDRFDCLDNLRRLEAPVLVFHGEDDTIVPPHHGRALADGAPHAEFMSMACDHNDCPPDRDAFWDTVVTFLDARAGLVPNLSP
ncbi:MAG: alpha/beta fold hydrolase [Bacteroidota bacterium]